MFHRLIDIVNDTISRSILYNHYKKNILFLFVQINRKIDP